jgi:hypothetical protein
MATQFRGTFRTEVKKDGEIGWLPFNTNVVPYSSQEAMDAVQQKTYRVWLEKYGFEDVEIDGSAVSAKMGPRVRIIAEFEAV